MIYHILNGDALKQYFPKSLNGTILIARECLVYGTVKGDTLDTFWKNRAAYLSPNSEIDYHTKVVIEFQKIMNLKVEDEVNLWFEKDLFCQVNLWFCSWLIQEKTRNRNIYFVQPNSTSSWKGFGGMNASDLEAAFHQRTLLSIADIQLFANLWIAYQAHDLEAIITLGTQGNQRFPFLLATCKAHIARFPKDGFLGRPEQILLSIINRLESPTFGKVFSVFCEEAGIYGFGDTQVKPMYDRLINEI